MPARVSPRPPSRLGPSPAADPAHSRVDGPKGPTCLTYRASYRTLYRKWRTHDRRLVWRLRTWHGPPVLGWLRLRLRAQGPPRGAAPATAADLRIGGGQVRHPPAAEGKAAARR